MKAGARAVHDARDAVRVQGKERIGIHFAVVAEEVEGILHAAHQRLDAHIRVALRNCLSRAAFQIDAHDLSILAERPRGHAVADKPAVGVERPRAHLRAERGSS